MSNLRFLMTQGYAGIQKINYLEYSILILFSLLGIFFRLWQLCKRAQFYFRRLFMSLIPYGECHCQFRRLKESIFFDTPRVL